MSKTTIEWTESSWNPVTGCTKISEGCRNCYAERMAKRLMAMGQKNYKNGFSLSVHDQMLDLPKKWKKPRKIFVNSMSDLFHESLPFSVIEAVFRIMNECYWHTFQVLTKRSEILRKFSKYLKWTENIWMGVSVECEDYLDRLEDLKKSSAYIKFISFEPLLSEIKSPRLDGIDWVIVGGESGPGCRPVEAKWVSGIKKYCEEQHVPFFFKQWGGTRKKKTGCILENREWKQMPIGVSL